METTRPYDFSGWATRNDLRCADGRTIRKNAFADCNGKTVPLVWNHNHEDPECTLGHVLLKNEDDGVRCYGWFNNTPTAKTAKECVKNGDITALSIWANQLKQTPSRDVLHGDIKEVSLVLAGANPGAFIDDIAVHSDDADGEAYIYTDDSLELYHADEPVKKTEQEETSVAEEGKIEDQKDGMTLKEAYDSMSEDQKTATAILVGYAMKAKLNEQSGDNEDSATTNEGDDNMKHNAFENDKSVDVIKHSDDAEVMAAVADAKRYGSMKESFLAHGIENVEWLFPDDHVLDVPPKIIDNDQSWVSVVMSGVKHVPFSRVKSMYADLTEEDARAKGYIKGNYKKEQVFGLLKRSTSPTTIYKKQKMDRDDMIDITSFDVAAWLKSEMRSKLNEEIARAILIGDGRLSSSDDKINEQCIRPIISDDDLFTIKRQVSVRSADTSDVRAKAAIKEIIRSRKDYKGSGTPTFFTSEDMLTEMLLLEDDIGRPLYIDEAALARKLRVSKIVTVPQMEGLNGPKNGALVGIIVNLVDYMVGADKGGAVNMFDDFDIDYNAQKYLIETRCSGALITPYSAITVEYNVAG